MDERVTFGQIQQHMSSMLIHQVRHLSSTSLKSVLHFDLVAYMEEVFGNAQQAARPRHEQTLGKLTFALLKSKSSMEDARRLLIQATHVISTDLMQQPAVHLFRDRLQAAVEQASRLSCKGNKYLVSELSKIPYDITKFLAYAPFMSLPEAEIDHEVNRSPLDTFLPNQTQMTDRCSCFRAYLLFCLPCVCMFYECPEQSASRLFTRSLAIPNTRVIRQQR